MNILHLSAMVALIDAAILSFLSLFLLTTSALPKTVYVLMPGSASEMSLRGIQTSPNAFKARNWRMVG